ncbi:radical SAM/SPASM domain-containing protein [Petrocella sp. FN5]|uniref:radical SAM/SPASM domain-containing protein n=1 Tax=Petrocella sp. FN5 TaxID=3032002 RepID=UPI0023DC168A|nr:radical SAM protein [Petrocella sp. FN5]MDF1617265.1 radical SAM protein [Petrocella sp. FN5]
MRSSIYNLRYKLKNNKYLLMNGCTGAMDEVDETVIQTLDLLNKETVNYNPSILKTLLERGYITSVTENEEIENMKKIAEIYQKVDQKLLQVTIIPTYDCNFRCPYCYELKLHKNGQNWMNQQMSIETVNNIFEYLNREMEKGRRIGEINLYGGEPFLKKNRKVIEQIIEHCKKSELTVMAISNGYEIENYYDLIETKVIREIQITLDGTGELHNHRRKHMDGVPTYKKTLEVVDELLKREIFVSLRTNIDQENIEEISALNTLFDEMGWSENKYFRNYFKAVHTCYSKEEKPITDEDIVNKLIENKSIFTSALSGVAADIATRIKYVVETGEYAYFKATYCGAVNGMLVFDPFGDIYPCWDTVGDNKHIIGQINQYGLAYSPVYDQWMNRKPQNIAKCQTCAYILYCGGGCPAHARVINQSIQTPYCDKYIEVFDKTVPQIYEELIYK